MKKRSRIGILGGSFNPPHLGHVGICEYVLAKKSVDAVWVIPCLEHPFDKSLVSFEHRFEMCRLAFRTFGDKVKVMDVERQLGGKSYTLRTMQFLQKEYPDFEWAIVVGQDAEKESGGWKGSKKLKKDFQWIVVPRGPKSPVPDVSATEIREAIKKGENRSQGIPDNVFYYIAKYQLY